MAAIPLPHSNLVNPLLTDMYQITMTYAYWKQGRQDENAVFDLFFRKNPFSGEYTIFAGLEESLRLVQHFHFTPEQIEFLRSSIPHAEPEFFDWLSRVDCSSLIIHAVHEGSVVFPRIPLMRIEGPLGVCQLLETPLLNLCNFASLMATNASRMRTAAGPNKTLLEFGLRRAQGPDGGMSASRYAYLGGFDATSNVLAGFMHAIPIKGTHAHAFVSSYSSPDELTIRELDGVDLMERALSFRLENGWESHIGELTAFVAYAIAFPSSFLALVDTYDTIRSGILNFLCVALALDEIGRQAIGIRLDSGDLAYLSKEARKLFVAASKKYSKPHFANFNIVASNDINEAILHSLNEQGHEIDTFGIGTHLVTCQAQPALGMVYKLVEIGGVPKIKLSQEFSKVTIPGKKKPYRLVGADGTPLLDIMLRDSEEAPLEGVRILCRHPFDEKKRAYATPSTVIPLYSIVWDGPNGGVQIEIPSLEDRRKFTAAQLAFIREDHLRPLNPTPYKVSLSQELFSFMHELWQTSIPVTELT